MLDTLLEPAHV